MSDTVVTLGEIEFKNFEVPESITFGGQQRLSVHELVGGARVIDAMGATEMPLDWSGRFRGVDAEQRARYLNGMRKDGIVLPLSWSEFSYTVVIKDFNATFERRYEIPYRISCEVLSDDTQPVISLEVSDIDSLMSQDLYSASNLVDSINNSSLTSAYSSINAATSTISSYAKATTAQLNTVLQPIANVRAQVKLLQASASNTIRNVTTLGGILPNNPVANQVAALINQTTALTQSPLLDNLDKVLARMSSNIGIIHGSQSTRTIAGGNLYKVAAQEYGDPMGWTAIAQANKLSDPQLTGINTLVIPPYNNKTGGVLDG